MKEYDSWWLLYANGEHVVGHKGPKHDMRLGSWAAWTRINTIASKSKRLLTTWYRVVESSVLHKNDVPSLEATHPMANAL